MVKQTLREHRRRMVLSVRDLAEKTNLSPTTIWRIEDGRVTNIHPRTMRVIADALEVPVHDIAEFADALNHRELFED